MKIKNVVLAFLSVLFVGLRLAGSVKAYETVSCDFTHERQFDWSMDSRSFAVLKDAAGVMWTYMWIDEPFNSGEPFNSSDYDYYLYSNGAWSGTIPLSEKEVGGDYYVLNFSTYLSFTEDKNYALAILAKSKVRGIDYLCDGRALVFGQEGVSPSWLNETVTVFEDYVSPPVSAPSGKLMGGVYYSLSTARANDYPPTYHWFASGETFLGPSECKEILDYPGSYFTANALSRCGNLSSTANFRVDLGVDDPGIDRADVAVSSITLYTMSDIYEALPDFGGIIKAGDFRLNSDKIVPGEYLGFSFNVAVPAGDKISQVYLKLGYLAPGSNKHLVGNMISEAKRVGCVGQPSCNIDDSFLLTGGLVGEYVGRDLSVWVVAKTENGLVCTDKPGVNAPRCGAGIKTVRLEALELVGPIYEPVVTPPPRLIPSPTPTPVLVVDRPVRITAAQLAAEYKASLEEEKAEENVIKIPTPDFSALFKW